jgi:hypothetical protein
MAKPNFFNRHLKEVDMSYWQHMRFALMLSARTFGCAIASFLHSLFPFILVTHTSRSIGELNELFVARKKSENEKMSQTVNKENNEIYQATK